MSVNGDAVSKAVLGEYFNIDEAVSDEMLRTFFLRRPWLRPFDWEQIRDRKPIDCRRLMMLKAFAAGWLAAKS